MVTKNFSEKLKTARLEAGLKKSALAELAGVSASMIGQYEAGKKSPYPDTLKRIAEALGKPVSYFTGEPPEFFSNLQERGNEVKRKYKNNELISIDDAFKNDTWIEVKVMDLPVGAGTMLDDDILCTIERVPSSLARGATHYITVRGDSMEPYISDGDALWVYAVANEKPPDGKIVIANIVDWGVTVRFITYDEKKKKFGLGNCDKIDWYDEDEIKIIGIVLQIVKKDNAINRMEDNFRKMKSELKK